MMSTIGSATIRVYGSDGPLGTIVQTGAALADSLDQTMIELTDGSRLNIPTTLLSRRNDGGYDLPYSLAELRKGELALDGQRVVIPIVAEQIEVGKRVVETGKVRLHKQVTTREELVDEPLLREEVEVTRVARNELVAGPVPVRYEGDVMIVSVLKEVLVVEKQLMLTEELHISTRRTTVREPQTVTLREEQLVVERTSADGVSDDQGNSSL